jgi:putative ABC transport system ATP-binding protein
LFRDLNATDSATIAVITHDRDLAASLPRQVELHDGRIVADHRDRGRAVGAADTGVGFVLAGGVS